MYAVNASLRSQPVITALCELEVVNSGDGYSYAQILCRHNHWPNGCAESTLSHPKVSRQSPLYIESPLNCSSIIEDQIGKRRQQLKWQVMPHPRKYL